MALMSEIRETIRKEISRVIGIEIPLEWIEYGDTKKGHGDFTFNVNKLRKYGLVC